MATLDEILRQVSLFRSGTPEGGLSVQSPSDTGVITPEQQQADLLLQKLVAGVQGGQANMPKTPPVTGQAPAFTPQPPYDQSQNALVGALMQVAGGGLKAGNSAPQPTMIAPATNPMDKPIAVAITPPASPTKGYKTLEEALAARDDRLEKEGIPRSVGVDPVAALNKGFLEDTYRPSEMARAMGASDRTIEATRQKNGTISFTNIGTKTWAEVDREKAGETASTVAGATGVTPETAFTVGNIKKVKDALLTEKDPTVIAQSISNLKTSATTFLQKMVVDEVNKQETMMGLPAMQLELQKARVADQEIAKTNPAGAVNARNVISKIEQMKGLATKEAERSLNRNMTFVGVKTELEGFDSDPLVQTATASMNAGIKNKFEAEDIANSLSPEEKANAMLVWTDAVDKDGQPDYAKIGGRLKRIPPNEKEVLKFSPYQAAQLAIADPLNTTANALFKNSLIKDGMDIEEADRRVKVAQSMVTDVAKFKVAYDAVVPAKTRPEGDTLLLPDVAKKPTQIQEDNLQKAMIVRDYMKQEATRDFTRKADSWMSLFAQDDPMLAKAISDVKLSGKEASVANVSALYLQGTPEEVKTRRAALQSMITKSIQAKPVTALGALNLDQVLRELPAVIEPESDSRFVEGAKWFYNKGIEPIFTNELSPVENFVRATQLVGRDLGSGFDWLFDADQNNK